MAAAFAGYQAVQLLVKKSGTSHARVQGISATVLRLNCGGINRQS